MIMQSCSGQLALNEEEKKSEDKPELQVPKKPPKHNRFNTLIKNNLQ